MSTNVTPFVSVIIPCYNVENYIQQGLDSVLKQTYARIEILCVDDGSSDNTLELLNEYAAKDGRIKVFTNDKNKGLIYTLNRLVELASTEVLVRFDPDDICETDRIERLMKVYTESNANLVSSDYALINEQSQCIKKRGFDLMSTPLGIRYTAIFNSPFPHPQSLIEKKIFYNHQYNDNFKAAEDYKLWCDLLLDKKFKGVIVHEKLYRYRLNTQGVSNIHSTVQIENHIKVAQFYLNRILDLPEKEINFWSIAKKTTVDFSRKNLMKELKNVQRVRKLFVRKYFPSNKELIEINSYTFQYFTFLFKNIYHFSIDSKIPKMEAVLIILIAMWKNIGLVSLNNIRWLLRNL
ncbi:glycosyltransferase family 2 protein [Chryseobacterium gotjawalense]|uniref:Glycosyltransferase family 2 protein n=1 Tax=Chryseobacterium gotjawalense TaxID=3042315 RepID=A0ABY8RIH2_9FLAO|nr:glycosyltransferase family 2 protein [Chryseobacterium sp. wdc7]WHF53049.1 glycosyltransferase family 2 protein [Chryseobacterium sp. wdc7]